MLKLDAANPALVESIRQAFLITRDSQVGVTENAGNKKCNQMCALLNESSAREIMKTPVKTETLFHLTNSSLQASIGQSIGLEMIRCKVVYPLNHTISEADVKN